MKLYQKFKTQWESDAPLLGKVEMRIPSSKKKGYIIGPKGSKLQVNFYESEINFFVSLAIKWHKIVHSFYINCLAKCVLKSA